MKVQTAQSERKGLILLKNVELVSVPECPVCSETRRTFAFYGTEHEYDNTTDLRFAFYRCQKCTAVYPDPRPSERSLSIIYPPNYYSKAAAINANPEPDRTTARGRLFYRLAVRRFVSSFYPYLKPAPGTTLLDIGCGGGRHLRSTQIETGCDAEGLDFDTRDDLLEKFSKPPFTLLRGEFSSYDFRGKLYDGIFAGHVIEHVGDPVAFLNKIANILRPEGIAVLEMPNEDCIGAKLFGKFWGGNHVPRHWFLPNAAAAEILVHRVPELQLLEIRYAPITFLNWSMHSWLCSFAPRKIADFLFPSDHRTISTSLPNICRHGIIMFMSMLEKFFTGKTSCMVMIVKRRA
jgi:2-polyprenyl-3-methyl-5-hydroxy-6-metoxy-1,4-benzoquinol methylase